jgi:hypothetical protein
MCRILVLTPKVMESCVFRNIASCSLLKFSQTLGRTFCFHHQDWRISQARNHHETARSRILIGLAFGPEDGGCRSHRKKYKRGGARFDRLCGLVVRVLDYRSRGPGFDSLALPKKKVVGLEGVHSSS